MRPRCNKNALSYNSLKSFDLTFYIFLSTRRYLINIQDNKIIYMYTKYEKYIAIPTTGYLHGVPINQIAKEVAIIQQTLIRFVSNFSHTNNNANQPEIILLIAMYKTLAIFRTFKMQHSYRDHSCLTFWHIECRKYFPPYMYLQDGCTKSCGLVKTNALSSLY